MYRCHAYVFPLLIFLSACSEPVDPYKAYEDQRFIMAKELLEPKVAEGDPKAMTYLAAIFQIERDFHLSEQLYIQAARKNYAPAQYNLGVLLHDGRELEKNIEQAYAWFYLASGQGHIKAQEQIARMGSEITVNRIIRAKKWAHQQLKRAE